MNTVSTSSTAPLPAGIEQLLADLVTAARRSFGEDLRSVVLFGSGAEGRLRATSDLNLLVVLKQFSKEAVDGFREPLRAAQVAGRAAVMFVLEAELASVAEAFAVKFDDIRRRRRLLYGEDLIASLATSRLAKEQRLQQILLNLTLRLRERYAAISLREEQLAVAIADMAGPLRAAAATLLELEGHSAASPKEALELVAQSIQGSNWAEALALISQARETRSMPAGSAGPVMFQLMALADAMRLRTEKLS